MKRARIIVLSFLQLMLWLSKALISPFLRITEMWDILGRIKKNYQKIYEPSVTVHYCNESLQESLGSS